MLNFYDLHHFIYYYQNDYVNFTIDLKLAAGQLKFVVGLSSRDNTIYYEENLGKISISEISSKEQPIYFPSGHGILLSDSRPSIHRSWVQ